MEMTAIFRRHKNDGSACINRQSADCGQNVITHCIRSLSIGKPLSYFTDRNIYICIYEVATMDVFIEYIVRNFAAT